MKLCTIGLGYIGLPTAAVFADNNVEVLGVDVNKQVVDKLNNGEIHIEEPGLGSLIKKVVDEGKFRASTKVETADVFIIAVPTPNNKDELKSCDLTYVLDATNQVMEKVEKGNIIIVESTIAPRTMEDYIVPIVESKGFIVGEDIYLVHCPERVLPGKILHEVVFNNRIIGGVTENCASQGARVYSTFVQGEIIKTNAKTAEMSKLMENTFRDVNIALANELSIICNKLNINVLEVIEMANKHPRVNLHLPGPGVGGHCLAVDPHFIVAEAPEEAKIIKMARDTNDFMPKHVVNLAKQILESVEKPKISILGITYKGDVDDYRESPAIEIAEQLIIEGINVNIYDPHVKNKEINNILTLHSLEETLEKTNLILILVDHSEFKNLDFTKYEKTMNDEYYVFDTKNINIFNNNSKIYNFGNINELINLKTEMISN